MAKIGVIIPTFDNPQYLVPCLQSILSPLATEDMINVYVVNNGDPRVMDQIQHPRVTILQQKQNIGWEGGLKAGVAASNEEFLLFLNDDTFVPLSSLRWLNQLLDHFKHPGVGAVGPATNVAMGYQNIFSDWQPKENVIQVNYLIGFCMLVRRSALEAAGGIDDTLPGGDDLDLSIRLRKAGYALLIDRGVFVYHHGFKTGERVEGTPNVKGGWNSVEKIEKTNWALIKKHGLREWLQCMNQAGIQHESPFYPLKGWKEDSEGTLVAQSIVGDKVLELGCGMRKTVPNAVGLDRVPKGEEIPGVKSGLKSEADIVADAGGPLPIEPQSFDTVIARHVLEHIVDPIAAVREWGRVIRHGGRLIIAVPNHELGNTIPMNYEHVHAWTPSSLKTFMENLGWKTVDILDPKNFVSLVGVFEANGLH
jgi:SAM-dependent methyltransferase